MRLSLISAALVAALVGYGSSVAVVLAAAQAVGASTTQTASWVAALCIGKAVGSGLLSAWTRVPVVLAWSTPGAALIAATTGINMNEAAGAFVFAGLLIALTGLLPPINRMVSAIPTGVASAMLAGVLLLFCMAMVLAAQNEAALVLPVIAIFLIVRLFNPLFAVIVALIVGIALAYNFTSFPLPTVSLSQQPFVFVMPTFSLPVLIGLGLPLYLVTMASQNLPGFAVLRANGYQPPVTKSLVVTGLGSSAVALAGAHTFNMAAITAAIAINDDVHPDKAQRWKVGLAYMVMWIGLGILGPFIIPTILALPQAMIAAVAGLALIGPLMGAVASAFDAEDTRFAAAVTFVVTASGLTAFGVAAAFWGLVAGLLVWGLGHLKRA